MSKRIVISETEKQRIKSLYLSEDDTIYGRKLDLNNWGDEEKKFTINNIEYMLTGGIHDKEDAKKWILHSNVVNQRTGNVKTFSGEKKFVFYCGYNELYGYDKGYDGGFVQGEKFRADKYTDVKSLIDKLKEQLC
jgi:hypothetical protein